MKPSLLSGIYSKKDLWTCEEVSSIIGPDKSERQT